MSAFLDFVPRLRHVSSDSPGTTPSTHPVAGQTTAVHNQRFPLPEPRGWPVILDTIPGA